MGFVKSFMLDNSGNAFVATVNYASRILIALIFIGMAADVSGYFLALAWLVLIHPIAWKVGDAFRRFTQPDAFLTSGAIDTFKTRIWWMIFPQLIATSIAAFPVVFIAAGFHGSVVEKEIANTPPMLLEKDSLTGYPKFNVNKDKDFGSYAFRAAVKDGPFVLTGGVPVVRFDTYHAPDIEDTADPNIKKVVFNLVKESKEVYVPLACVNAISMSNKAIYEKVHNLPNNTCEGRRCSSLIPSSSLNLTDFENKGLSSPACQGKIVDLPGKGKGMSPTCVIHLDGKVVNDSSSDEPPCQVVDGMIYTLNGRSTELEKLHANKKNESPATEPQSNSSQSMDSPALTAKPAIEDVAPVAPSALPAKIAPSFDCTKASNKVESLICSDNEIATLDNQLAALYKVARESTNEPEKLKAEQISWVKMSRQCSDVNCLSQAYQMRISQLKK